MEQQEERELRSSIAVDSSIRTFNARCRGLRRREQCIQRMPQSLHLRSSEGVDGHRASHRRRKALTNLQRQNRSCRMHRSRCSTCARAQQLAHEEADAERMRAGYETRWPPPGRPQPSLVAFSGGTAFNGLVASLRAWTTRVAHVLPVSDDGGSTAEIVRVLGGPAVGDIRSRCLRLSDDSNEEARAVRALLGHRLSVDSTAARHEWYGIVEGEHTLWHGVSAPYKHTIRSFLVYFHAQIMRHASERFNFANGSIGNFFFAGARTFFQSLDAAIFLYSRVSGIPNDSVVLPVTSTNSVLMLGAELEDGSLLRGQSQISHPPSRPGSDATSVEKSASGSANSALPSAISYATIKFYVLLHQGLCELHLLTYLLVDSFYTQAHSVSINRGYAGITRGFPKR